MMRDYREEVGAVPDEFAGVQSTALTALVQHQLPVTSCHILPLGLCLVTMPVTLLLCVSGLEA